MPETPSLCFAPAVVPDIRVLILGSLPGKQSLEKQQYYGHPRNHFWRLISELIGRDLVPLEYEERLALLNAHQIGIWDVVASAIRPGSLDQHIRSATPNSLHHFVTAFPALTAIGFNGGMASRIGRKQLAGYLLDGLDIIDLPSSSPANTIAYQDKLRAWGKLRPYLQA